MINKLLSALFNSRTQAHIFHLQTRSFAKHKALKGYYEDIIPLIDAIAESYQGEHGIITGYEVPREYYQGDQHTTMYFEALKRFVESVRPKFEADTDLANQIDEVIALVKSTLYLLKELE